MLHNFINILIISLSGFSLVVKTFTFGFTPLKNVLPGADLISARPAPC